MDPLGANPGDPIQRTRVPRQGVKSSPGETMAGASDGSRRLFATRCVAHRAAGAAGTERPPGGPAGPAERGCYRASNPRVRTAATPRTRTAPARPGGALALLRRTARRDRPPSRTPRRRDRPGRPSAPPLAQLVVHFMADPIAGLREMSRVTRPGGVVAA
jgi:hypothetical protein